MKRSFSVLAILLSAAAWGGHAAAQATQTTEADGNEVFSFRVVTTGLADPWELTWGPDDHLWVTENSGRRVTRVNPADGSKTTLITIPDVHKSGLQDGLLGMAFHPGFLEGIENNYVYLAFTYDADPGDALDRRTKIVRYSHDRGDSLVDPVDLITGLPASDDHNSGRLVFGPDDKLYYALGDQGNNQFARFCNPIEAQRLPTVEEVSAQDWSAYVGKILRLDPDGGIPLDNPTLEGLRSHVFSYGHRNPQGLAFSAEGLLFSSEHGPKSDDEINRIEAGKNYGWPQVAGFIDDQAYVYVNWSAADVPCPSLTYSDYAIPEAVPRERESESSHPDSTEPLKTLYTVPNGYNFQDPTCADLFSVCWPTVAPSSIEFYPEGGEIAGWGGSLLMTTLKSGALYRVRLTGDGHWIQGDVVKHFRTVNRYRDLALSPDGRTIYVATDSGGTVASLSGSPVAGVDNPGAILAFEYRAAWERREPCRPRLSPC
jgi:PQQ-dependent dehydrogenase (s-GDH family)